MYITGEEGGTNRLFALDLAERDLYQLSGVAGGAAGGIGGMPFDAWENAALLDTGEIWMNEPDGSGLTKIGDTIGISGATETTGILDISRLVGFMPGSVLLTNNQGSDASLSVLINPHATSSPALGDFNGDGIANVVDIDQLTAAVIRGLEETRFDLNDDDRVDEQDRQFWVQDIKRTCFGDSDLDGQFDSSDLVQVFARARTRRRKPQAGPTATGTETASSTPATWSRPLSMAGTKRHRCTKQNLLQQAVDAFAPAKLGKGG